MTSSLIDHLIDKGIEYVEGKMDELSTVISKSKYNAALTNFSLFGHALALIERAIDAYNENEGDANNEANQRYA